MAFCSLDSLGYDGSGEKIRGFDMSALLQDFDHKVMAPKKPGPRSGVHWSAFDVPMIDIAADSTARMDLKYWEPSVIDRIGLLRSDHGQAVRSLNLVSTRRGKSPPADVYVDENDGFALVVKAGSNINSHGLLQTDASSDYVEKSVYEDLPEHCKIQQGDVLLSSTGDGTLGKACVYDREDPAIADGHVTIIRVDPSITDPYFLADYLRCGFGADQISRLYTGSTGLIELTPEHVNEIVVPNLKHAAQVKASKLVRKAESDFRGGVTQANAALLAARANFVAVI